MELIADRQFETGQKLTLQELARETGVHRTTLSKMANQKGYVSSTEVVDKLCDYFGVPVEKLMTHVDDDQ